MEPKMESKREQAILDLKEFIIQFAKLPASEQMYIKGRMDSYKDQKNFSDPSEPA